MRTGRSARGAAAPVLRSAPPARRYSPCSNKQKARHSAGVSEGGESCSSAVVRLPTQKAFWDLQLSPQQIVFRDMIPFARRKAPLVVLNKGSRPQRVRVWGDERCSLRIGAGSELSTDPVTCPLLPPGLSLRLHVEAPPLVGPAVRTSLTVKSAGKDVEVPVEALPPLIGFRCPPSIRFPPALPGQDQQQLVPVTNTSSCTISVHIAVGQALSASLKTLLQKNFLHVAFHPQALTLEPDAVGFFTLALRLDCPGEIDLPLHISSSKAFKPPRPPRGSLATPQVGAMKTATVRRAQPEQKTTDSVQWAGVGPVVEGQIQTQAFYTIPRWALTVRGCDVKVLDFGTAYYGEERCVQIQARNLSALPLALAFAAPKSSFCFSHEPAGAGQEAQGRSNQREQTPRGPQQLQHSSGEELPQEIKSPREGYSTSPPISPHNQDTSTGDPGKTKGCNGCDGAAAELPLSEPNTPQGSFQTCLSPGSYCSCRGPQTSSTMNTPSSACKGTDRRGPSEGVDGPPNAVAGHSPRSARCFTLSKDSPSSGRFSNGKSQEIPTLSVPEGIPQQKRGGKLAAGGPLAQQALDGPAVGHKESTGQDKAPRKAQQLPSTVGPTAGETHMSAPSDGQLETISRGNPPLSARNAADRARRPLGTRRSEEQDRQGAATKRAQQKRRRRSPLSNHIRGGQQVMSAAASEAGVAMLPQRDIPNSACQRPVLSFTAPEFGGERLNQPRSPKPSLLSDAHLAEGLSAAAALGPMGDSGLDGMCQVEVTPQAVLLAPHATAALALRLCTQPYELRKGFQHAQAPQALQVPLTFQLHLLVSAVPQALPWSKAQNQVSDGTISNTRSLQRRPRQQHVPQLGSCSSCSTARAVRQGASPGAGGPPHSSSSDGGSLTARTPVPPCKGRPIVARLRPETAGGRTRADDMFRDEARDGKSAHCCLFEQEEACIATVLQQHVQSLLAEHRGGAQDPRSPASPHRRSQCRCLADTSGIPPQEKAAPPKLPFLSLPLLNIPGQEPCSACGAASCSPHKGPFQPLGPGPQQPPGDTHQVFSGRCTLRLPCVQLSPDALHFQECRVGEHREKSLCIINPNNHLPLDFSVDVPHPFRCVPASGQLLPQQRLNVQVFFTPRRLGPVQHRLKVTFCKRLYTRTVRVSGTAFGSSWIPPMLKTAVAAAETTLRTETKVARE